MLFAANILAYLLAKGLDLSALQLLFGAPLLIFWPGWLPIHAFAKGWGKYAKLVVSIPVSLGLTALAATLFLRLSPSGSLMEAGFTASLLVLLVFCILTKQWQTPSLTPSLASKLQRDDFLALIASASSILILGGLALRSPFIPEVDGYNLINGLNAALGNSEALSYRALFPSWLYLAHSVTGTSLSFLVKWFVPLLTGALIPLIVGLVRKKTGNQSSTWVLLVPLVTPLFLTEQLYGRPQSFLFIWFSTCIALLVWFFVENAKRASLFWISLALSVISLATHEAGILLLGGTLLAAAPWIWSNVRKHPQHTIAYALLITALVVLSGSTTGPVGQVTQLAKSLLESGRVSFEFWFIDSYTDPGGTVLGWPGYLGAAYYVYNLGFLLPLLLLWRDRLSTKLRWSYIGLSVLPVTFAEIAPRFGIAYYPERAWLYISLALLFVVASSSWRAPRQPIRIVRPLLVLACAGSIVASISVELLKKPSWITQQEVSAVEEVAATVKDPKRAIFFTQGSLAAGLAAETGLTTYYAPELFAVKDATEFFRVIASETSQQQPDTSEAITSIAANLAKSQNPSEFLVFQQQLTSATSARFRSLIRSANRTTEPTDFYFVFSSEKLSGIYATRSWWRELNAAGFDPEAILSSEPRAQLVYRQAGVQVWRLNLSTDQDVAA